MKLLILIFLFSYSSVSIASELPLTKRARTETASEAVADEIDKLTCQLNSQSPSESLVALTYISSRPDLIKDLIHKMVTAEHGFRQEIASAIFIILKRDPLSTQWIRRDILAVQNLIEAIQVHDDILYTELME